MFVAKSVQPGQDGAGLEGAAPPSSLLPPLLLVLLLPLGPNTPAATKLPPAAVSTSNETPTNVKGEQRRALTQLLPSSSSKVFLALLFIMEWVAFRLMQNERLCYASTSLSLSSSLYSL